MQKYEIIENGILKKDIKSIRESVGNICYTDRNFSKGEFDEIVKYVMSKGINIKEDILVGKLVSEGKDSFCDDDFTRAVFELKKNFCDERINDVKRIGKILYKKDIRVKNEGIIKNNSTIIKDKNFTEKKEKNIKNIALPVAIVISITAIATIFYFIKK